MNIGGEVTADRVRKVDKHDWISKKIRGKNRWTIRTGGPRDIGSVQ